MASRGIAVRISRRCFSIRGICASLAVALLLVLAPGASARQRWPIIGCWDFSSQGFNHYLWEYKPGGLCAILETTAGIDHARWKHWGSRQATGTGQFVDALGFMYPAKLTAYGLHVTHNFLGEHTYAAWYTKLHVVAKREYRGEIYRGPFNLVLDVTPSE